MAKVEVEQETGEVSRPAPPAELVVGIPGLVDAAQVRTAAAQWTGGSRPIAVVFPRVQGMSEALETLGESGEVRLVAREISAAANAAASWLGQPAGYAALLAEAGSLGAGALR